MPLYHFYVRTVKRPEVTVIILRHRYVEIGIRTQNLTRRFQVGWRAMVAERIWKYVQKHMR